MTRVRGGTGATSPPIEGARKPSTRIGPLRRIRADRVLLLLAVPGGDQVAGELAKEYAANQ
ncbi:hypothetical protein ITP53_01915 [Nonomuraea sp. K274]|uniref:Uncharacterized protein n=1 Tax=Nonomuraea cypriaca TaxID=1187855 RepID=A0A931EVU4_9ACTN|nr:hypothetical protein [Nonomuraea cypriaca]MBF8184520.1 hypothetical protein [Nonomuraea cypriaca]